MKSEFNVILNTKEIAAGFTVKIAHHPGRRAAAHPRLGRWPTPARPGSGSAVLPAYIVTEDLIEYHWSAIPTRASFQLGTPGSCRASMWS